MNESITRLIRQDLQNFTAYSSARDEKLGGEVFMNANESPWDYFASVENIQLNRYPLKQPTELMPRLAELYQVNTDQLLMLRGSDEGIDVLTRLFCAAGQDAIMICPPTFGMYKVCAHIQGVKVIEVYTRKAEDYVISMEKILNHWTPAVKIIFLCSPNNPTGSCLDINDILYLCEQLKGKCLVVVDEAYVEFSNQESLTQYIGSHNNLAVLRTLSKLYGLAAARCGFLLGNSELIEWAKRITPPYPVSSLISHVVEMAVSSERLAELRKHVLLVQNERERLFSELKTIDYVTKVWPSVANYLLVEVNDLQTVMNYCDTNGFVLRSMQNKPELENCLRISIGKPEENTRLLKLLRELT